MEHISKKCTIDVKILWPRFIGNFEAELDVEALDPTRPPEQAKGRILGPVDLPDDHLIHLDDPDDNKRMWLLDKPYRFAFTAVDSLEFTVTKVDQEWKPIPSWAEPAKR